jgi:hypothetical protein
MGGTKDRAADIQSRKKDVQNENITGPYHQMENIKKRRSKCFDNI